MCIAKGLVSIIVIITLILPQIEAQAFSPGDGDPAAGNYNLNYYIPSNFLQSTCIYTSL